MAKHRTAITSKGQTTIPKPIRDRLGVGPRDAIYWDVVEGEVRVTAGEPSFFRWFGAIRVGRGSTVADIERARGNRGRNGAV